MAPLSEKTRLRRQRKEMSRRLQHPTAEERLRDEQADETADRLLAAARPKPMRP